MTVMPFPMTDAMAGKRRARADTVDRTGERRECGAEREDQRSRKGARVAKSEHVRSCPRLLRLKRHPRRNKATV
jgi:hypothetical protein